ncbi:NAD(P)H-dependent oxidoreductase subunit E [candidate division WOR-3 bacterium]|nr:NAD(P)H-dependent oxidoreductase subunit E [candidate division WOR-3 bacterium]
MDKNDFSDLDIDQKVCELVNSNGYKRPDLIQLLQDITAEYNYLPEGGLRCVSERLGVTFAEVYSAATFYKAFSLEPRGKHIIQVCVGTACHVRGASRILEEIERRINIKAGETSEDFMFTLETVNCLGACALGPIIVIDGEYHGQMTPAKVSKLLERYTVTKRVKAEAVAI